MFAEGPVHIYSVTKTVRLSPSCHTWRMFRPIPPSDHSAPLKNREFSCQIFVLASSLSDLMSTAVLCKSFSNVLLLYSFSCHFTAHVTSSRCYRVSHSNMEQLWVSWSAYSTCCQKTTVAQFSITELAQHFFSIHMVDACLNRSVTTKSKPVKSLQCLIYYMDKLLWRAASSSRRSQNKLCMPETKIIGAEPISSVAPLLFFACG